MENPFHYDYNNVLLLQEYPCFHCGHYCRYLPLCGIRVGHLFPTHALMFLQGEKYNAPLNIQKRIDWELVLKECSHLTLQVVLVRTMFCNVAILLCL